MRNVQEVSLTVEVKSLAYIRRTLLDHPHSSFAGVARMRHQNMDTVVLKIIIALTVSTGLVCCEPPLSNQYGVPGNFAGGNTHGTHGGIGGGVGGGGGGITNSYGAPLEGGHDEHQDYIDNQPKSYEFGYAVKDATTGNDFGRRETSDGETVRGEYRVQLPDGRTQIVTYTADWRTGFHADVRYEGDAVFPDQYNNNNNNNNNGYNGNNGYDNNNGYNNQHNGYNGGYNGGYNNGYNHNGPNNGYNHHGHNNGYNPNAGTGYGYRINNFDGGYNQGGNHGSYGNYQGGNYNAGSNYNHQLGSNSIDNYNYNTYSDHSSGNSFSSGSPTPTYGAPFH